MLIKKWFLTFYICIFDIFELILMKLIRNLVLNLQAFLQGEKVYIENNFKKIYKFLTIFQGY